MNLEILPDEIWKDTLKYPELFSVSNHGRVWSKRTKRILKQHLGKSGYYTISSRVGGRLGKVVCFKIHGLVASSFITNTDPVSKIFVNHIDGCKTNNHVDNLEWVSPAENSKHAVLLGLLNTQYGEKVGSSKLLENEIKQIRFLKAEKNLSNAELGRMFGVRREAIRRILSRCTWDSVK